MTEPEQVSVNVADLQIVVGDGGYTPLTEAWYVAKRRLRAALPESEWEPTDDEVARTDRAVALSDGDDSASLLRALHREGLIP